MRASYGRRMKRGYDSISDIQEHRVEVADGLDGELPDYLVDYFDNKERVLERAEFFNEKRRLRASSTYEEKAGYFKGLDKEFWDRNEFEVVKKRRRLGSHLEAVYEEPARNLDRVKEDEALDPDAIRVLVAMCEKDLYLFAIRYFSHYLKVPSSSFHRYLYKFLSDNLNSRRKYARGFKHAVPAPRSSAKSTIISNIFPLWCVAYNKKKFIIIVSDTLDQATDFLSDIKREIINNELLQRDFPHMAGKGPIWKQDEIITNNDVKLLALGTKSKIRGRKFGIHRVDLLIGDDLENSDMVRSEAERTHIRYEWFNKDFLHAHGEKGTYTDILIVGTILNKYALLPAILDPDQYPDWTTRKFKAVLQFSESPLWDKWEELYKNRFDKDRIETARAFFEEHKAEMLDGAKELWPEGDPYYDLMVDKISDYSAFLSEKMNDPIDPSKILIPYEKLRFENFSEGWIKKILQNRNNPRYGALDPSLGKKSNKGDYSSITTIVRDLKSGYIFVIGLDLKRRSVEDQIKSILRFHTIYRYKLFAVETNAFQLVVADNLRRLSRKSGLNVPIKDVIVTKDKKMRLEKHIPIILDGTVIFDKYAANNKIGYSKSLEQLTTFIGDSSDAHDDAVDSLSMCLDLITRRTFKLRTKQNRRKHI